MAHPFSRRSFLKAASVAAGGLPALGHAAQAADDPAKAIRDRIALSDLHYAEPPRRSEEGLPIGNGRMGSLVWTTASQVRLQINRVDAYPAGSASNSFNEAHNDYCGGCAWLDLRFEGRPFRKGKVALHLSVYDGIVTITGDGVKVEIVAAREPDVFAIAIQDRRGSAVTATLRALRYAPSSTDANGAADTHATTLRTRSHLAVTRLHAEDAAIALSQEFREVPFRSHTAVMAAFASGAAESELLDEASVALIASDATTLFVSSAAGFGDDGDSLATARRALETARTAGMPALAQAARAWWHDFWDQGSLALHSADGTAERVQRDYHYYLYLMAATSGGKFPPKFNGMLWNTGGDPRAWGAQHWYTNTSCYQEALPASGRLVLTDPFFDLYSAMLPACRAAAEAQWGSQGIFIPETVTFDGPEPLPPEIAAEMRALYLSRKPWAEKSPAFLDYATTKHPYASVWNWKTPGRWEKGRYLFGERGHGPYGPTSHIFATTAKIAYHFWLRYEFTQDRAWLAERAYPMLRGAVEFYRHHPMVRLEADGRFHIQGSNNSEPIRDARDASEDLAALRAVIPALLRAAALLDRDKALQPAWRDFLDRLAPLPCSDDPDVLGADLLHGPRTLAAARGPARYFNPDYVRAEPHTLPVWFFDLCGVEARDTALRDLAQATLDRLVESHGPASKTWNNGLTKLPIAAALLGRAELVRDLVPRQMGALAAPGALANTPLLRNRLSLGEGAQAMSAQHLGRASEALQLALLQSAPPAPGEDPILHLFPAWPTDWDADYRLHARGGFVVEATMTRGAVTRLELRSKAGAPCRLRNPFPAAVTLQRDGRPAETLTGSLLSFPTRMGETIALIPGK
ncbi:glycoside hydrolase family 95-like protein [Sphingomonas sp. KR3-1]|uniref:glycosyl hydrolase family 95 catalytic domain-containing protein n=1 Tax=Sphingomonas sp. KR3-1 TaxID=3156611 RepID=UPI0032B55A94